MAKAKKKRFTKARRVGRFVRAKAAKPSLAIIFGLGAPAAQVVLGGNASRQLSGGIAQLTNPGELVARFNTIYGGDRNNPSITSFVTKSNALKLGALGFVGHYLANLSGANRYLARMKWPVRI